MDPLVGARHMGSVWSAAHWQHRSPHVEQEQGWGWKGVGEFGWGGKSDLWHAGKPQQAGWRREDPLSLFPVVSVLARSHCLYQQEELGSRHLTECCVETNQLLCLCD